MIINITIIINSNGIIIIIIDNYNSYFKYVLNNNLIEFIHFI